MPCFRLTSFQVLLTLASLVGFAACGEKSTVGPAAVPADPPNRLTGRGILLHVDIPSGVVRTGPRSSAALRAGGDDPRFALLGDHEIGVTTSSFFRSQVGEFKKKKVRIRFDVELTNLLTGASLVTPTFPPPPLGQEGLLLIPFQISQITGGGKVASSTDWDGDGSPGSGFPYNFFNDLSCPTNSKNTGNDCYRWEAYASPLGPGATSEARTVGFDVDPEVQSFDLFLVLAADLENVKELGDFATISAGGHTCGVTPAGDAFCWANNDNGELGDGNTGTDSDTPVPVQGGHAFESISAGTNHTCGLTPAGDALCWGDNVSGELGDGNAGTDSDTPVAVQGGHAFASISAGTFHTCGVTPAGDALCWGSNTFGQLGDGNTGTDSDTPVAVEGGHAFATISAGFFHTCGVTAAGDALCWGSNGNSQLGDDGNAGTISDTPVAVEGGHAFATISAGAFHTCGVTPAGDAFCWGGNIFGALGDGNAGTDSDTPVAVQGGHDFATISAGLLYTCGVTPAGDAFCWGGNTFGQLGDGNAGTDSDTPAAVEGGHAFASISGGSGHTCGVTAADAFCWGDNFNGQLGDGNAPTDSDTPVRVAKP